MCGDSHCNAGNRGGVLSTLGGAQLGVLKSVGSLQGVVLAQNRGLGGHCV